MLKSIVKGNNLFNPDFVFNSSCYAYDEQSSISFPYSNGGNRTTAFIYVEPLTTYTFSSSNNDRLFIGGFSERKTKEQLMAYTQNNPITSESEYIIRSTNVPNSFTFTTDASTKMICIYYSLNNAVTDAMLNSGSQPLPYEPYQTVHDITRIPMRSKNLFDAKTAYGNMYNDGIVSGTTFDISRIRNYFTSEQIGKQITISIYANKVTATRIYVRSNIADNVTDSNYISTGDMGVMSMTITPQSINDYWGVTYGSYSSSECIISNLMLNEGSTALPYVPYGMVEGWEVRDQQGRIIWGADKTLTGTDSITYKGYGLDIKEYDIEGNMVQAAEKAYSITGTFPLDFQSNGSNVTISISGNETQASNQAYTTSGTSPLSFNADGTNLTALSMDGNMNQASSQPYTVSGTSPISFMNNGTAIDYTVSGNMNQTGTPTPTSPITPQECGVRTGNLWNFTIEQGGWSAAAGTIPAKLEPGETNYSIRCRVGYIMPIPSNTMSFTCQSYIKINFVWINTNGVSLGGSGWQQNGSTVTAPENATSMTFILGKVDDSTCSPNDFQNIMLNLGSTALPYEPYGYKIPVTNGSTTYNIYLSEPLRKIGDYSDIVNSDGSVTRVIKKQMLTGQESTWSQDGSSSGVNRYRVKLVDAAIPSATYSDQFYISHYGRQNTGYYSVNKSFLYNGSGVWCYICEDNTTYPTVDDYKTFLAQQYQNGTPVTIWYVLSTAQTDTATVPTITPTSGNNTLSVDTTLAPSNITITSNSSVFPGNPITPIECGVKTENLLSEKYENRSINGSGAFAIDNNYDLWIGEVISGQTYTISNLDYVYGFFTSKPAANTGVTYDGSRGYVNSQTATVTIPNGCNWIAVRVLHGADNAMLNTGNEPLPYEPYGKYKIPITVGSTTKNIFINQPIRKIGNYSDSIGSDGVVTRNIKKLVLDGTENWSSYSGVVYLQNIIDYAKIDDIICICTHYEPQTNVDGVAETTAGHITFSKSANYRLNIHDADINNASDYKLFLVEQYQNGTPVELWYVLSTPDTTETTAIPTISTVNGANTLTTQTAITPSNITISTSSSVYPKNPIYPEECGDKTDNLFNVYAISNVTGLVRVDDTLTITTGETITTSSGKTLRQIVGTIPTGDYTLSATSTGSRKYIYLSLVGETWSFGTSRTLTSENIDTYLNSTVSFYASGKNDTATITNIMLNSGSTAATYEPYGYKIPITIGSNTNYIYTKEPIRKIGNYADVVNSDGSITRRIKKKEFNGSEFISTYDAGYSRFYTTISDLKPEGLRLTPLFSTHYQCIDDRRAVGDVPNNSLYTGGGVDLQRLFIKTEDFTDSDIFKAYLAQQYQNGKPVTIWYALETPTTEQTTIPTLTTVDGTNTATIGTTLSPSSITINATSKVYPNNPIIPEECGDLTENLVRVASDNYITYDIYTNLTVDDSNQTVTISGNALFGFIVKVSSSTQYTVKASTTKYGMLRIREYSDIPTTWEGNFISQTYSASISDGAHAFTTTASTEYILVTFYFDAANAGAVVSNIMLNLGDTAKPYEPYGKYKVPIINNGVTKNIYLNQPIRKIGNYSDVINSDGTVSRHVIKVEITGDESIVGYEVVSGTALVKKLVSGLKNTPQGYGQEMISSHFESAKIESTLSAGKIFNRNWSYYNLIFGFDPAVITSLQDARDYFNAQITAAHPVEIWYVSATPETESITTPTLTTIEGTNTIEVDTTLSPSKIDITLHGKYAMWNAIRNDVRNGTAPSKYPVGTILYDSLTDGTGIAFQVVGYDKHFDPSLTAQGYTHSMTLCEYKLTDLYQFDAIEAFLYTSKVIPAGTYRFTIPNYDATYGGNKTYYFTSTADLPKNSQIVMNWSYQQTPKTVTAYSPTSSITAMENTTAATGWNGLTLTEYVSGESPTAIDLGTIAGPSAQAGTSNYGEMNHIHRARYGSNNYLQSGLRQYLNSTTAANTWWKPQTIFDRPYGNRNQAGKLSKLNQNLVSVLATPSIQSRTNSYFETTSLDGTTFTVNTNYNITTDKLFLLSPMEVGFNTTDTTVGTLLDYYIAGTSTDANNKRIKYRKDNNNAYYWWLRTPYPSRCDSVRYVYTSGALSNNLASSSVGVATACIIQ